MKNAPMVFAVFLSLVLLGSVFTNFAFGYEKENHYWLKIALALNCGFDLDESRLIAIGDFGIDEDPDTQPVRLGGDKTSAKWKWHALPTEDPDVPKNDLSTGNQEIKQRQHDLYDRAMKETNTSMKLFKFGQYLHYEEDKWSHWGYTTGMGHAIPEALPGVASPDSTHAHPDMYRYMVFDSMVNLGNLAKSLGIKTKCESDLVPLDTYKSAPEYGSDFPWFSPQEIKRAKNPAEFEKMVNQKLYDWKKSQMIDENFQYSKIEGASGVTKNIIRHVSDETKISVDDITKKYDFKEIDIDGDGNLKMALPADPKKALEVIDGHTSAKTGEPSKADQKSTIKTDSKQAVITPDALKSSYVASKWFEFGAQTIVNIKSFEIKFYSERADSAWGQYDRSKSESTMKSAQTYENLKNKAAAQAPSATKILDAIRKDSKSSEQSAIRAKISPSELEKIAKEPLSALKDKSKIDSEQKLRDAYQKGISAVKKGEEMINSAKLQIGSAAQISEMKQLYGQQSTQSAAKTSVPVVPKQVTPAKSDKVQPTPSHSASVSVSPKSVSFTHTIGSSPCPTPMTTVTLSSDQDGTWSVASVPYWISATVSGNQVLMNFNCQLQSYTSQTLTGNVALTFTSSGGGASATIQVTGTIKS